MTQQPSRFQAVVFWEDGWWIAVCLQHGLVTYAREREQIGPELQRLLRVQIEASRLHGLRPFNALPVAPAEYWRMYADRNGAQPEAYELPEGFSVEAFEVSAHGADAHLIAVGR
jgi:hypothetical protein